LVATPASAPRDTKTSQYHQLKDAQAAAKKRSASDGGLNASDAALAGLDDAVTLHVDWQSDGNSGQEGEDGNSELHIETCRKAKGHCKESEPSVV